MTPSESYTTEIEGEGKPASRLAFAALAAIVVNALFLVGASVVFRQYPVRLDRTDSSITVRLLGARGANRIPAPPDVLKPQVSMPLQPKVVAAPVTRMPSVLPVPKPSSPATAPVRTVQPAPQKMPSSDAYNRVLLAKSSEIPEHTDFVMDAGGNAPAGQPMERQGAGNGTTDTEAPVVATTDAGSPPAPAVENSPTPAPQPSATPIAEAKPIGLTRDARATHQVLPRVPASLQSRSYKSFVRVEVKVDADGNFTPKVLTSCGSPDIDDLVLLAMKRWQWEPELKDGVPVASTSVIRVDYEVN